jgi:hypothetical protein
MQYSRVLPSRIPVGIPDSVGFQTKLILPWNDFLTPTCVQRNWQNSAEFRGFRKMRSGRNRNTKRNAHPSRQRLLACRCRRRRLPSLTRQRPPLPALDVAAATNTDGGGCAQQIVAVHRCPCRPANSLVVPSTSVAQRCHNHRHQAVFSAAAAAAAANLVGDVPFHKQRNQLPVSKKQNSVIYYLRHNF